MSFDSAMREMDVAEAAMNVKQYEVFGTMYSSMSFKFFKMGLLTIEEISIPPFSQCASVIELTEQGKYAFKRYLILWDEGYGAVLKKAGHEILDDYGEALENSKLRFALNRKRFDLERKEGRLNKVLKLCPRLGPLPS